MTRRWRSRRGSVRVLGVAAAAGALLFAFTAPANADEHVSQSTAQAVNINLLSDAIDVAISNPETSAINDGTDSNDAVVGEPMVSLLPNEGFLGAGALAETAEANQDGTSYACSGIVSPGGGIQVGDSGNSCTATGSGDGGVSIDLSKIPGLGGVLSTLASVTVTADSLTAHAYQNGTDPATGGADIAGLTAHVNLVGGLLSLDLPLSIPAAPNQGLLSAIVDALVGKETPLNKALLDPVISALTNAISDIATLTVNWQQPIGDPGLEVSALHVELLNGTGATADLAHVSVGPNAPQAPTPVFSSQSLPIALAVLALIGLGVVLVRRQFVRRPGSVA